jgi:tryptophan halogenase
VGEGTTFSFPNYIHGRLGLDPGEFHRVAEPSWKLGIRFFNWGPRPFFDYTFRPAMTNRWQSLPKQNAYYCEEDVTCADLSPALMSHDKVFLRTPQGGPLIGTDVGYHIENEKFVSFLERYAQRMGVGITDGTVLEVNQDDRGIAGLVLKEGATVPPADLYIDCTGFFALLLGKTLGERFECFKSTLLCDRAVVGGWDRTTEPIKPYTAAEGMNAGWCWQIEHEHRVNRGYVYSSDFISDEEAEREFRGKNPKVSRTRIVRFVSGRYQRTWVKNVVAIGNSAGFVEPMEATALGVICDESDTLANCLAECECQPGRTIVECYNKRNLAKWDNIRAFLAIHYKFNTRLDTSFWRACRETIDLVHARPIVDYYQENGPGVQNHRSLFDPLDQFGFEGYWALLVGQKVPYRKTHVISADERMQWRQVQETFRMKAMQAVDIPEALRAVRREGFIWPKELYTPRSVPVSL